MNQVITYALYGLLGAAAVLIIKGVLSVKPIEQPVKREYVRVEGDIPRNELKKYDGSDISLPVLVGVNGVAYDVSSSDLYLPGGGYNKFAGRDVTRNLAKMSFEEEDYDQPDTSTLTPSEMETLLEWQKERYEAKYRRVGKII